MDQPKTPLLLAMRIPFYPIRCAYDPRPLLLMDDPALIEGYFAALRREAQANAEDVSDMEVQAMRISGGIAGHVDDEALGSLLRDMHALYAFSPDAEITLKVHPGMISADTMSLCRRGGVTRLSVDYATSDPFESEAIGRFLPPSVMETSRMVIASFPVSLSFDILVGLPGQSETSLVRTLQTVMGYGAAEVVLYPFRLIPGTPFSEKTAPALEKSTSPRKHLPNPEEQQTLHACAQSFLLREGFMDCGKGHYAREGHAPRFEALRQAGTAQLGLGAGAKTILEGAEMITTGDVRRYIRFSPDTPSIVENLRQL